MGFKKDIFEEIEKIGMNMFQSFFIPQISISAMFFEGNILLVKQRQKCLDAQRERVRVCLSSIPL